MFPLVLKPRVLLTPTLSEAKSWSRRLDEGNEGRINEYPDASALPCLCLTSHNPSLAPSSDFTHFPHRDAEKWKRAMSHNRPESHAHPPASQPNPAHQRCTAHVAPAHAASARRRPYVQQCAAAPAELTPAARRAQRYP